MNMNFDKIFKDKFDFLINDSMIFINRLGFLRWLGYWFILLCYIYLIKNNNLYHKERGEIC